MRLGTSTTMGFNRPHGVKADIPDVVRILAEAGFKVQDMNFHDCSNFPTPLLTDKWESWVTTLVTLPQNMAWSFPSRICTSTSI